MTHNQAKEHVRKVKGFWIHFGIYAIVNVCLAALNLIKEPNELWFFWVAMGWGIGVLAHCFLVYGGGIGKNWERKKIQELTKNE